VSNIAGYQPPPIKCTTECAIAKRNAKLADALGINPLDKNKDNVIYNDELLGFARANSKFLPIVEKAFADFVRSDKRHQVLPHMTPEKRKFVHDVSSRSCYWSTCGSANELV
jgi:transcriptional repressor NF-X1